MYVHLNILEIKNKEQVFLSLSLHEEKQKHNIWMIFSPKNFIACEVSDKNQSCGRRSERNRRSDSTPRFSIEATNVCINSCVGVDDWSFFFFGKLKERKRKKNKTHLIAILYTALYITLFTSVQQGKITKWFRTIWWKVLFVFFPSSSFPSLPPSFILKLMVHVGRKNTLRFARQKHPHACDIEHKA